LLELPLGVREHLESGGTVVTASAQRAAALVLAYSTAQLSAGRSIWASPDILPWGAWLDRAFREARAAGARVPLRLPPLADQLLWREAVSAAGAEQGVLAPERLVQPVQRALALLEEHGLTLPASTAPEVTLLRAASALYRGRCERLGAIGRSWGECAAYLVASPRLLLVGFEELGAGLTRWLGAGGARVADALEPAWPAGDTGVVSAAEPAIVNPSGRSENSMAI